MLNHFASAVLNAALSFFISANDSMLAFTKRAVGDSKSFRLLDVGFGDGDMLRAIARWAQRRKLSDHCPVFIRLRVADAVRVAG